MSNEYECTYMICHSLILVDWRCKKMVGREAEGTKGDYFELKQIQLWIIVS